MPHIQILIGFIILLSGGVAITQLSILYRRLALPFLRSFIHFLTLLNLYFFMQTVLAYYFLNIRNQISPERFFWINAYTDLIFSVVLLWITWLAVRLAHQLGRQKPARWIAITFSLLSLLLLSINIHLLIKFGPEQSLQPFLFIMLAYVVLFHLAVMSSLLRTYVSAAPGMPQRSKRLLGQITWFMLALKGLSLLCLALFTLKILPFNFSYYAVFLIYNLVPIIALKRIAQTLFTEELTRVQAEVHPSLESRYAEFGISKREQEIIELVLAGYSNRDIEDKLFISLATVKDHIYKIYKKTGVRNRVQLVNLFRSQVI